MEALATFHAVCRDRLPSEPDMPKSLEPALGEREA
jgi:hypothetical protein